MTFQHKSIPVQAGIGLRTPHFHDIITTRPDIGWFEVHPENYFGKGGKHFYYLEQIRQDYPLSLHGVGLALGSTDELSLEHLSKIKNLIDRFQPDLISEHLCWSKIDNIHLNDLLPLPLTSESLKVMSQHIHQTQDFLGKQILIENISSYLQFAHSTIPEPEFLTELSQRTGCGILLDINNLFVNSYNHGWDALQYIQKIPPLIVKEIHLAGHTKNTYEKGSLLIDTHNHPVAEEVWELYRQSLSHFGKKPTLIEWDSDIPDLSILLKEAKHADTILESMNVVAA